MIDIAPRENVTYSKETQTPATDIVLDKDGKMNFAVSQFLSKLADQVDFCPIAKPLDYYGNGRELKATLARTCNSALVRFKCSPTTTSTKTRPIAWTPRRRPVAEASPLRLVSVDPTRPASRTTRMTSTEMAAVAAKSRTISPMT